MFKWRKLLYWSLLICGAMVALVIGRSIAWSLHEDALTIRSLTMWGPRYLFLTIFEVGVVVLLALFTGKAYRRFPTVRLWLTIGLSLLAGFIYTAAIYDADYIFIDARSDLGYFISELPGDILDQLSDKFIVMERLVFGFTVALLGRFAARYVTMPPTGSQPDGSSFRSWLVACFQRRRHLDEPPALLERTRA